MNFLEKVNIKFGPQVFEEQKYRFGNLVKKYGGNVISEFYKTKNTDKTGKKIASIFLKRKPPTPSSLEDTVTHIICGNEVENLEQVS